jgi:hypothetical protein
LREAFDPPGLIPSRSVEHAAQRESAAEEGRFSQFKLWVKLAKVLRRSGSSSADDLPSIGVSTAHGNSEF